MQRISVFPESRYQGASSKLLGGYGNLSALCYRYKRMRRRFEHCFWRIPEYGIEHTIERTSPT
jgi:hypothetical protein